jgi:hypothetical protein
MSVKNILDRDTFQTNPRAKVPTFQFPNSRCNGANTMKKTKHKRDRDAVKALQALPPPPSATIFRWDASLSADHYCDEASKAIALSEMRLNTFRELSLPDEWHKAEIANCGIAQALLWEAKHLLLRDSHGLTQLLNRSNWATTRLSISVFATFNIRGNLKIDWTPPKPQNFAPPYIELENTTGFKDDFIRKCFYRTEPYGNARPHAELMWFRNVPLAWPNDGDHPAIRYIIYAIHSKYQQILRDLGNELEVVDATRFEFLHDDDNQVEWSVA